MSMYEYHALSVSLSLLLDLCRYRPCCSWCRGSAKHREILSADNHEAILGEAACHRHCHVDVCTRARTQTRAFKHSGVFKSYVGFQVRPQGQTDEDGAPKVKSTRCMLHAV
jgi:hypothetical protein